MTFITRAVLLKDMIDPFGEIRFRHMGPFNVDGMSLLLDACAETLGTLRLYLTDPDSKQDCPKGVEVVVDEFTTRSSLQHFGLSRNKSFQILEVTGIVY